MTPMVFSWYWSRFGLILSPVFGLMATVFLPTGRNTYFAKLKLWDAGAESWVWKKVSTGCRNPEKALEVANALEGASEDTNAGRMTRDKVEALVRMILELAGSPWLFNAQTLQKHGEATIAAKMLKAGSASKIKFGVHWERFKGWAGARLSWPLERWSGALLSEYYADLLTELSERTASDHLSTLRMIFERARHEGLIKGNPVALVEKDGNQSVEKSTLSRKEVAAIVRVMRRKKRKDWALLTLLGWHTGHRLQDLMSLTQSSVERLEGVGWVLTIAPAKKKNQGGRVVRLPVPAYLAKKLQRMKSFKTIHGASNITGKASNDFVEWVRRAGIDPLPIKKKQRTIHLKSFHSFRHSMVSRLVAAGVQGETARLVTDHESAQVHKLYTHAEIESLAKALKLSRGK